MYRAREEGGGGGKGWLAEEGKGAKIVVGHVGWGGEGEGGRGGGGGGGHVVK